MYDENTFSGEMFSVMTYHRASSRLIFFRLISYFTNSCQLNLLKRYQFKETLVREITFSSAKFKRSCLIAQLRKVYAAGDEGHSRTRKMINKFNK